jgi:hypothetical protein
LVLPFFLYRIDSEFIACAVISAQTDRADLLPIYCMYLLIYCRFIADFKLLQGRFIACHGAVISAQTDRAKRASLSLSLSGC